MDNQKLLILLQKLLTTCEWFGSELGMENHISVLGSFTLVHTLAQGFHIKVKFYDYREQKTLGTNIKAPPDRVTSWRSLPNNTKYWIEITIEDIGARFGRRKILDRFTICPDENLYMDFEKIFAEIQKIAKFFKPSKTDRLSADNAFTEMLRILAAD